MSALTVATAPVTSSPLMSQSDRFKNAESLFVKGDFEGAKRFLVGFCDLKSRILRGRIREIEEPGVSYDLIVAANENPNSSTALAWAGHSYAQDSKTRAKGFQLATLAANRSPNDPDVISILGRVEFMKGERSKGLFLMLNAEKSSSRSFVVVKNLAESYLDEFDSKNALAEFNKLVIEHCAMPMAYFYRACFFKQIGDKKQAMIDCERALGINPVFQPALSYKALWLFQAKDFEAALKIAKLCLVDGKDNTFTSKALRVAIDCELALSHNEQALIHLKQLINWKRSEGKSEESQQVSQLNILAAKVYERLGLWNQCEMYIQKIGKRFRTTPEVLILKAKMLTDQNKLVEALSVYNDLLGNGFPAPDFYIGRAEVYKRMGKIDLCASDLCKAKELRKPGF